MEASLSVGVLIEVVDRKPRAKQPAKAFLQRMGELHAPVLLCEPRGELGFCYGIEGQPMDDGGLCVIDDVVDARVET